MQLIDEFSHRAAECMNLAERATTPRDKELFMELAKAWYGIAERDQAATPVKTERPH